MNKTRKFPLFAVILLSVLLIMCVAIYFGLKYLWVVLDEYENTMPEYVVDEVGQLFEDKNYDEIIRLSGLAAGKYDSQDDLKNYLEKLFDNGDIKWGKKAGSNNANCYVVASGKTEIGQIFIKELEDKTDHGFTEFVFDRLTVPFEAKESVKITVPFKSKVYVNDIELGSDCITESNIKVSALKNIESELSMPYYETYTVSGLIAPASKVRAVSSNGTELTLTHPDNAANVYSADFVGDDALQSEIYPIVEDFAKRYSEYLTSDGSFRAAAKYIIYPSSLYTHLRGMETYFYTNHDSYKFENMNPYGFVKYTDELCSASISFDHYLYRSGGTKQYHYKSDFTVFFVDTDDGWLIDSMQMNYTDNAAEQTE